MSDLWPDEQDWDDGDYGDLDPVVPTSDPVVPVAHEVPMLRGFSVDTSHGQWHQRHGFPMPIALVPGAMGTVASFHVGAGYVLRVSLEVTGPPGGVVPPPQPSPLRYVTLRRHRRRMGGAAPTLGGSRALQEEPSP